MKQLLLVVCAAGLGTHAFADKRPDDHAPIGVMADHVHERGEWMFSYRYMSMAMEGNRIGDDRVSAETIATTVPNRFFGIPGQPPTLRVVPTEMTMGMHMLGAMWAQSDRLTWMAMLRYLDHEMDHLTFSGGSGTTVLGGFTTEASGLGDTTVSALVRLKERGHNRWLAQVGLSLPTGALDETGRVLAPTGATPILRLPYPMQLGSGTVDAVLGTTASGSAGRYGWGAQWSGIFRLGENDEDYTLGDEHRVTAWGSLGLGARASLSARLAYLDRGDIDGIDPQILAPVQTADPNRQGIERWDFGLGMNFVLPNPSHRLALEVLVPFRQDLAGPQLEADRQVIFGYQFAPD